jgi:hypothetical protein
MARTPKTNDPVEQQIGQLADSAPIAEHAALAPTSDAPTRPNKTTLILDLLRREEGATLAELIESTGWLPHTTRAALTGLRKKGHVLDKSKRDDATCYRIAGDA